MPETWQCHTLVVDYLESGMERSIVACGEQRTPADTAGATQYHQRWNASDLPAWTANEGLRLAFWVTSCGDGTSGCSIRYLVGGQSSGINPSTRTGDYYR